MMRCAAQVVRLQRDVVQAGRGVAVEQRVCQGKYRERAAPHREHGHAFAAGLELAAGQL